MELFFDVNRTYLNQEDFRRLNNSNNIVTVSSGNLLAFSTNLEVETEENRGERKSGYFVYVSDLNVPWFTHEVTSRNYPISIIEFDKSGKFLFVADANGFISVYIQKNNLINEWMSVYEVLLAGENVLKATFFHNGFKLKYNHEKKDQTSYSDKYQRVKFSPSVRKFGGVGEFGCLLITATGLIATFLIPQSDNINPANLNFSTSNNNNSEITTESLGVMRTFYNTADVAFTNDGNFLVAVSNSKSKNYKSCLIQCFKVSVTVSNSKLAITSNSLPSFFPCENNTKDYVNPSLIKFKWLHEEDPDSILILVNHSEGSVLEQWKLTEEATPIHKMFQNSKNNSYKISVWNNKSVSKSEKKATTMLTSKFLFGVKQPANYIFIAYQDNSVLCMNTEGSKNLASVTINTSYMVRGNNSEIDISPKQTRMTSKLTDLDVSHFGHLLIALDSVGQLYCYKCNFIINESLELIPNSITQSVNLLEYCLVSGVDTLDVMWSLKLNMLDQIIDKLTENFNRQNSAFIQFYYVKFLTMKISLQRLSATGQNKANDLLCLLNLHSILTAFKSLLRPADLTSRDKGPAENLAMILSESVPDVDKVLLNLEAKDFTVEPSTLQSLQQLIQWVADLALNILAKLPECRGFLSNSKTTGDISDIVALSSIRELLVMIRIWGLLKPSCLPQFLRSTDNLDVLLTIFKLLSKLALNPNDPDEYLLDECCLLPNQVLVPQLQMNVPRVCVSSFSLVHLQAPLHFEYGTEYEKLRFIPEQPTIEGCLTNNNITDSIRYIQIGKNQTVRRCTRCGAYASLNNIGKTVAMKAWENRFSGCNGCGGSWQKVKT